MDLNRLTDKKNKLDGFRPLAEPLLRNLEEWFRIELTYTSNAIEGNTLSRRETALVVEKGITVGGKTLVEHLEATNHAGALDWVKTKVEGDPSGISESDILHMHEMILEGINSMNAGRYRSVPVRISGSAVLMPNPRKVPDLMKEFSDWLSHPGKLHPAEFAAEAHYRLVSIHPFVDGNGRTGRLLMNLILLMNGYPPAVVRKRDRLAYISSLEKAQLGGSLSDYKKIIFKAVERSLDIYLKAVTEETESSPSSVRLLKIGELAKEVGETSSTIRHWTKEGLLEVSEYTAGGYQLFSSKMIDRIKQIRSLKLKRLTIQEIKFELDK